MSKKSVIPAEPSVTPRLLTMQDAAKYLSCAYWGLRRMVMAGEIPKIPIGRRYCIDRLDLDKWIEKRKVAA